MSVAEKSASIHHMPPYPFYHPPGLADPFAAMDPQQDWHKTTQLRASPKADDDDSDGDDFELPELNLWNTCDPFGDDDNSHQGQGFMNMEPAVMQQMVAMQQSYMAMQQQMAMQHMAAMQFMAAYAPAGAYPSQWPPKVGKQPGSPTKGKEASAASDSQQKQKKHDSAKKKAQPTQSKPPSSKDGQQDYKKGNADVQAEAAAFLEDFKSSPETAIKRFGEMAFESIHSSRLAQEVFRLAKENGPRAQLGSALQGRVLEAAQDKHANYVLQLMIDKLPLSTISFILKELQGNADKMAMHSIGLRLILRLLEHMTPEARPILGEVMLSAAELCSHKNGSVVMKHVLEKDDVDEYQRAVLKALKENDNVLACAVHKQGRQVVEAAFENAGKGDILDLQKIIGQPGKYLELAKDSVGRHVVIALLKSREEYIKQPVMEALLPCLAQLDESKTGELVSKTIRFIQAPPSG